MAGWPPCFWVCGGAAHHSGRVWQDHSPQGWVIKGRGKETRQFSSRAYLSSLSPTHDALGCEPKLANIYTFGRHSRSKLQSIEFGVFPELARMDENKSKAFHFSLGQVHPNPNRPAHLRLKMYEFAGRLVGKCLYESSLGGAYKQLVRARFTRSFLAQIIGLRMHYKVIR